MALCLAAGLDGIERELMPPEPIGKNMYHMTDEQLASMNVETLPRTLGEACKALEEDTFIQEVLGPHVSQKFLEAKKKEWNDYCKMVSQWELDEYLYKF